MTAQPEIKCAVLGYAEPKACGKLVAVAWVHAHERADDVRRDPMFTARSSGVASTRTVEPEVACAAMEQHGWISKAEAAKARAERARRKAEAARNG